MMDDGRKVDENIVCIECLNYEQSGLKEWMKNAYDRINEFLSCYKMQNQLCDFAFYTTSGYNRLFASLLFKHQVVAKSAMQYLVLSAQGGFTSNLVLRRRHELPTVYRMPKPEQLEATKPPQCERKPYTGLYSNWPYEMRIGTPFESFTSTRSRRSSYPCQPKKVYIPRVSPIPVFSQMYNDKSESCNSQCDPCCDTTVSGRSEYDTMLTSDEPSEMGDLCTPNFHADKRHYPVAEVTPPCTPRNFKQSREEYRKNGDHSTVVTSCTGTSVCVTDETVTFVGGVIEDAIRSRLKEVLTYSASTENKHCENVQDCKKDELAAGHVAQITYEVIQRAVQTRLTEVCGKQDDHSHCSSRTKSRDHAERRDCGKRYKQPVRNDDLSECVGSLVEGVVMKSVQRWLEEKDASRSNRMHTKSRQATESKECAGVTSFCSKKRSPLTEDIGKVVWRLLPEVKVATRQESTSKSTISDLNGENNSEATIASSLFCWFSTLADLSMALVNTIYDYTKQYKDTGMAQCISTGKHDVHRRKKCDYDVEAVAAVIVHESILSAMKERPQSKLINTRSEDTWPETTVVVDHASEQVIAKSCTTIEPSANHEISGRFLSKQEQSGRFLPNHEQSGRFLSNQQQSGKYPSYQERNDMFLSPSTANRINAISSKTKSQCSENPSQMCSTCISPIPLTPLRIASRERMGYLRSPRIEDSVLSKCNSMTSASQKYSSNVTNPEIVASGETTPCAVSRITLTRCTSCTSTKDSIKRNNSRLNNAPWDTSPCAVSKAALSPCSSYSRMNNFATWDTSPCAMSKITISPCSSYSRISNAKTPEWDTTPCAVSRTTISPCSSYSRMNSVNTPQYDTTPCAVSKTTITPCSSCTKTNIPVKTTQWDTTPCALSKATITPCSSFTKTNIPVKTPQRDSNPCALSKATITPCSSFTKTNISVKTPQPCSTPCPESKAAITPCLSFTKTNMPVDTPQPDTTPCVVSKAAISPCLSVPSTRDVSKVKPGISAAVNTEQKPSGISVGVNTEEKPSGISAPVNTVKHGISVGVNTEQKPSGISVGVNTEEKPEISASVNREEKSSGISTAVNTGEETTNKVDASTSISRNPSDIRCYGLSSATLQRCEDESKDQPPCGSDMLCPCDVESLMDKVDKLVDGICAERPNSPITVSAPICPLRKDTKDHKNTQRSPKVVDKVLVNPSTNTCKTHKPNGMHECDQEAAVQSRDANKATSSGMGVTVEASKDRTDKTKFNKSPVMYHASQNISQAQGCGHFSDTLQRCRDESDASPSTRKCHTDKKCIADIDGLIEKIDTIVAGLGKKQSYDKLKDAKAVPRYLPKNITCTKPRTTACTTRTCEVDCAKRTIDNRDKQKDISGAIRKCELDSENIIKKNQNKQNDFSYTARKRHLERENAVKDSRVDKTKDNFCKIRNCDLECDKVLRDSQDKPRPRADYRMSLGKDRRAPPCQLPTSSDSTHSLPDTCSQFYSTYPGTDCSFKTEDRVNESQRLERNARLPKDGDRPLSTAGTPSVFTTAGGVDETSKHSKQIYHKDYPCRSKHGVSTRPKRSRSIVTQNYNPSKDMQTQTSTQYLEAGITKPSNNSSKSSFAQDGSMYDADRSNCESPTVTDHINLHVKTNLGQASQNQDKSGSQRIEISIITNAGGVQTCNAFHVDLPVNNTLPQVIVPGTALEYKESPWDGSTAKTMSSIESMPDIEFVEFQKHDDQDSKGKPPEAHVHGEAEGEAHNSVNTAPPTSVVNEPECKRTNDDHMNSLTDAELNDLGQRQDQQDDIVCRSSNTDISDYTTFELNSLGSPLPSFASFATMNSKVSNLPPTASENSSTTSFKLRPASSSAEEENWKNKIKKLRETTQRRKNSLMHELSKYKRHKESINRLLEQAEKKVENMKSAQKSNIKCVTEKYNWMEDKKNDMDENMKKTEDLTIRLENCIRNVKNTCNEGLKDLDKKIQEHIEEFTEKAEAIASNVNSTSMQKLESCFELSNVRLTLAEASCKSLIEKVKFDACLWSIINC